MGRICISFDLQQRAKAVAILLATFSIVSASVCSASSCVVDNYLQSDADDARTAGNGAGTASLIDSPVPTLNTSQQQNSDAQPAFMPGKGRSAFRTGIRTELGRPVAARSGRSIARTPLIDFAVLSFAVMAVLSVAVRRKYRELKRYADVIASIVLLSAFSPLMLLIALLIKIDSPGPVIIKQVRVGLNRRKRSARGDDSPSERRKYRNYGSLFMLYKFRTMYADAEAKTGPVWARKNDDRITRFGALLRKTHLDELPQFMNVLKGDMGIIGPRPERPVFTEQLRSHIRNFDKRLLVKPGITGLAQVRYRYAASIADTRKKLKYDLLYIKKMCITMDMRILLNTFNMLMTTDKGAR
jgi:lipopolysaccharide/colanic/teichoic acid biosynthesis glycosyltransferase